MSNSIEVTIQVDDEQLKEQLLGELSMFDFDGFEEVDDSLIGYYKEGKIQEEDLNEIFKKYRVKHYTSSVSSRNWNVEWESSFSPVLVRDFCAVRADFHSAVKGVQQDIIITPKMSFGTGHHATTYLMLSEMATLDFKGKSVADFGTGTGVLAILAEKLGAAHVWAVDNDDWSIENARENIERNSCQHITIQKVERFYTDRLFDVILANINKNIILQNLQAFVGALKPSAKLLLSGLLIADEMELLLKSREHNLIHLGTVEREGWVSILFSY